MNFEKPSHPNSQIKLFNYEKYFNFFVSLYQNNKLPNVSLLSGNKGIGKSTFVFHFVNYILSANTQFQYSLDNYSVNENNKDFQLIKQNIHPNFYYISNTPGKNSINIEQIRNLLSYLNKTAYFNSRKIVLIDNAESLNKNSSNALLKVLEEINYDTNFFIIHNSSCQLIETIKSRCIKFNIFLDFAQRKDTVSQLINQYNFRDVDLNHLFSEFKYESPGNILKYLFIKFNYQIENKGAFDSICHLINQYIKSKNHDLLKIISILIENFYYKKTLQHPNDLNFYLNKNIVLNKIDLISKFNLDSRNIFFEITSILEYEKK